MKLKILFFAISLILLTSCESHSEASPVVEPAKVIDQGTVKPFLVKLASDYLILANELEANSRRYEEHDDLEGFVRYRNREWTPNYTSKKIFYEHSFQKNEFYLQQHNLERPFEIFASLIYIGLDLKHGLQNHDQALTKKAHQLLLRDIQYMQKVKEL